MERYAIHLRHPARAAPRRRGPARRGHGRGPRDRLCGRRLGPRRQRRIRTGNRRQGPGRRRRGGGRPHDRQRQRGHRRAIGRRAHTELYLRRRQLAGVYPVFVRPAPDAALPSGKTGSSPEARGDQSAAGAGAGARERHPGAADPKQQGLNHGHRRPLVRPRGAHPGPRGQRDRRKGHEESDRHRHRLARRRAGSHRVKHPEPDGLRAGLLGPVQLLPAGLPILDPIGERDAQGRRTRNRR